MDRIWFQLFAVMLGASILKYIAGYPIAAAMIDVAALGVCYIILRQYPYVDIKKSMVFLSILTAIAVLSDIGVIGGLLGNLLLLAVMLWFIFRRNGGGGGRRRPPVLRHKWHK